MSGSPSGRPEEARRSVPPITMTTDEKADGQRGNLVASAFSIAVGYQASQCPEWSIAVSGGTGAAAV
jgi:hypothetical protein